MPQSISKKVMLIYKVDYWMPLGLDFEAQMVKLKVGFLLEVRLMWQLHWRADEASGYRAGGTVDVSPQMGSI